ncbi:MAG: HEAT repeat domain-containing protein [Gemmatimonadales bacterium]
MRLVVAIALLPVALGGQGIGERIASVTDGKVRMTYASRAGVCGNGRNINMRWDRQHSDWEHDCEEGPAHVQIEFRDGRPVDVEAWVGGRWRDGSSVTLDLGLVSAPAAAEYLLSLGVRGSIFPAVIADSITVWPRLIEIARDGTRPDQVRRDAIFWVAQAAGDSATAGLARLTDDDPDREVRKHAVFALSQIRSSNAVDVLIRVARTNRDPEVRRSAIFWLGQSRDPRALDYFEAVLRG